MNNLFLGRTLKFWVATGLSSAVFLMIFWLVSSFMIYKISVTGGTGIVINSVSNNTQERKSIFHIGDYFLLPRDTDFIELQEGRSIVRSGISQKPLIGVYNLTVPFNHQRAVTKIGRNSLGCNILNPNGSFHFRCDNSDRIMRFGDISRSEWDNTEERQLNPDSFSYSPYKNGILRIGYVSSDEGGVAPELRLEYVVPGITATESIDINTVNFEPNDILALHTNVNGGDGFVIQNTTKGKVYYFSTLTNSSVELSQTAISNLKSDIVSCSLRDSKLACYYGVSSYSPDGKEEEEARSEITKKRNNTTGSIEIYDFTNKTTHVSKISATPLDEICLADNNITVGVNSNRIVALENTTSTSKITVLADDGIRVSCGANSIYTTEKGIFQITGYTSSLLFSVNHHDISTVNAFGKTILFNTFVSVSDSEISDGITHTYQIKLDSEVRGERIEDKLPYAINGGLPLFDLDYNDKIIYIQPSYDAISDRATGQMIVDEESFNRSRALIEAKLRADGLLDSGREIIFSVN